MSNPFGLRDVKIAPVSSAGVVGTFLDLPNAQTFTFSESEDYTSLRGDDREAARRGNGPIVEWELDSGGISLPAYAILNGGTVTTTGTGATAKTTYSKLSTDSRPYFWVEGQAISESGGDFHMVVYKCIADDSLEGELNDGEFWISKASGHGLGNLTGKLYDFVENATATAIAQPT